MRTSQHWDECKNLLAFIAAEKLAFSLRQEAIKRKLDPKGIRVLSKQSVFNQTVNVYADAQVVWLEGPIDWAYTIVLTNFVGVCSEAHCGQVISFYEV